MAGQTPSLPTLIFEVSYGTGAWATPSWTDESARLRSFKSDRGRQHELALFDAGTSTVVLEDSDRVLDPTNTGSAHAGQLVPGVQHRLRATWGATTYPVFHHNAERWTPKWPVHGWSRTELTGADAFKAFRRKKIASTAYAPIILTDTPWAYYRAGDTPGSTRAADSSGNARHATPSGLVTFGVDGAPVAELDTAADLGTRAGFIDVPVASSPIAGTSVFTVEGWFKFRSADPTQDVIWWSFGGTNSIATLLPWSGTTDVLEFVMIDEASNVIQILSSSIPYVDGLWHHIVGVRTSASAAALYFDGVLVGSATAAPSNPNLVAPVRMGIGGTSIPATDGFIDEFAIYPTALSAARILAHYNAGVGAWGTQYGGARIGQILDTENWPAANRDIDTGLSLMQPVTSTLIHTTMLDAMQQVERSEAGQLYMSADNKVTFRDRHKPLVPPGSTSVATFGDGAGEIPYEPAPDMWLGDDDAHGEAIATRVGGAPQRVFDQTALDNYQGGTITRDNLLLTTDNEVADIANWDLLHHKTPIVRIGTIRIHATIDPATIFPIILNLKLGDRVTVKRRPPPMTSPAFTQDGIVEHISHEKTDDGDWWCELALSAADTTAYWILGTSQLGISTVLCY